VLENPASGSSELEAGVLVFRDWSLNEKLNADLAQERLTLTVGKNEDRYHNDNHAQREEEDLPKALRIVTS